MYQQIKKYLQIAPNKIIMKKIVLFSLSLVLINTAFSQEDKKNIYFLADTINISKENRALDIMWTTPFHYSFVFNTPYKAPYYNFLEFSCLVDKKNPSAKIKAKKPNYAYLTIKELLDIVREHLQSFDENYNFYITELLPDNKYQTRKVKLMPQSSPTNDRSILKENSICN